MLEWAMIPLQKCASFSGRARRKEFWYFILVYDGSLAGLLIARAVVSNMASYVAAVVILAAFLPALAVTVRRLHDTGRSWIYALLVLPGPIGHLMVFVLAAQDSQRGDNKYGPDPKAADRQPLGEAGATPRLP